MDGEPQGVLCDSRIAVNSRHQIRAAPDESSIRR